MKCLFLPPLDLCPRDIGDSLHNHDVHVTLFVCEVYWNQLTMDATTCNLHPGGREVVLKTVMLGWLVYKKEMEWSTYLKTILGRDRANQNQQMVKRRIGLYFVLGHVGSNGPKWSSEEWEFEQ